jgi:peptidoglycan/xylan/chitin deacetylase (PgdA/CDA1 family)
MTGRTVTFRIDVDTPTGSLLLNRLHLKPGYLRYLRTLLGLMREFGIKATFMFIPNRTTPSAEILGEVLDTGSEVALHADEVLSTRLAEQKADMERSIGKPVAGLSYHGRDLIDFFVHKVTRKNRYVAYHNPFSAMLAGFRYDATGYLANQPGFLRLAGNRILLFNGYRDITYGPPIPDIKSTLLQQSINIYMIHPNYLDKYGFRRKRRDEIRAIFDHVSRSEVKIKTYVEICEEYERMAGP